MGSRMLLRAWRSDACFALPGSIGLQPGRSRCKSTCGELLGNISGSVEVHCCGGAAFDALNRGLVARDELAAVVKALEPFGGLEP